MRKIEMTVEPGSLSRMLYIDGASVYAAIGYLSTWGLQHERNETVHLGFHVKENTRSGIPEMEIQALYIYEGETKARFLLAGIWNAESRSFSFHS